jgi:hypothetical protein
VNQVNPPAAATWLLEHMTNNEALAGDLLEGYRQGRSAGWFWRQVVAALAIGLVEGLRARCPAVVFAALWSAMPFAWWWKAFVRHEDTLIGHVVMFPWPYSTICTLTLSVLPAVAFVWLGLAVCLLIGCLKRTVRRPRVLRALRASFLIFVPLQFAVVLLSLNDVRINQQLLLVCSHFCFFVVLLVSTWLGLPVSESTALKSVS